MTWSNHFLRASVRLLSISICATTAHHSVICPSSFYAAFRDRLTVCIVSAYPTVTWVLPPLPTTTFQKSAIWRVVKKDSTYGLTSHIAHSNLTQLKVSESCLTTFLISIWFPFEAAISAVSARFDILQFVNLDSPTQRMQNITNAKATSSFAKCAYATCLRLQGRILH